MNTSLFLFALSIFPIKSLDGIALTEAVVVHSGALKHDREFALFDEKGRFVNGKNNAKVHLLRSTIDLATRLLSLQVQGKEERITFHLDRQRLRLEAWFSDYFGFKVKLVQNTITGFPDDTNARGPTVISTGTIETIASCFPGVSVEEMRARLRTNIEIGGVPPFWEDQLFTKAGQCVQFQIGNVLLEGINPCQRCIVPARDSKTAAAITNFQKVFTSKRRELLPQWTVTSRFNHFYRLAVNTNIPESEVCKTLNIGDIVKILGVIESKLY